MNPSVINLFARFLPVTSTADLLDDAYKLASSTGAHLRHALRSLSLRRQCSFVTADEKL